MRKIVVLMIFTCAMLQLRSQDMHFTQFYASPLYLNPAFAGADVCSRISLTYRNQWPGIQKTYKTYMASIDHYFQQKNIGAGLQFASDVAGSGDLKTTVINGQIAYEARLTKMMYMRLGLQPGIGIRSVDYNKLLFGDQIARGSNVPTIEQPSVTKAYFDIGAGALFYTPKYWGGFSAYHLNKPSQSLREDPDGIVPVKISLHGGFKYAINPDEKEDLKRKSVSPALNYRHQNKFDQLDIGLYYSQSVVNIGMWYRGIPLFKAYAPGYSNNDALAVIIGVKTARFNFGYSYDVTISRLSMITHGAHEITTSYQLCKQRKKKRYRLLVPCPKF